MFDPIALNPPLARIHDARQRLLRPAIGFNRPADVLKDPLLDDSEKRAILASWASDACTLADHPDLRWFIGSDGPVPLNEVLEVLARLDRSTHQINPSDQSIRSIHQINEESFP